MTVLKKCICLILAIMTVSAFPVLAAETADTSTVTSVLTGDELPADTESGEPIKFSDVDYDSVLGKTVEKLVDKGVISGFPDGTFKAEQTLTRAEFSKIIVSFASAATEVNLDSGFPDVDNVGAEAHWAKPYIKVAKDLKIISGFPDGTFHPDEAVTYEQAVKMIMCARGYTDYTYPDGFMQIALQKKLLTGSTHTGANSAAISRGTTVILINNAYDIAENSQITIGGGSSSGSKGSGGGGGSKNNDTEWSRRVDGVVWGNKYTMLDTSKDAVDTSELAIKHIDSTTKEETVSTFRLAEKLQKNAANYIGKNVRATIKEDDSGKEYISAIEELKNKNYSLSVDSEDIDSVTYNEEKGQYVLKYISGNSYAYHYFNKETDSIYVIYNGKSICSGDAEGYKFDPAYITGIQNGKIKILSNDSDKEGDVIIVSDYKTGVVKSKSTSTGVITLKYGAGEIDTNDKDREVSIVSAKGGNTVSFTNIKSSDVVDYAQSLDGKVLSLIVSAAADSGNAITGTITKVTEDKVAVKPTNATKATEYELNENYIDYLNNVEDADKYYPLREDRATVRLNSFGKVAAIDQVTTTTNEYYGYIMRLGYSSGKQKPEDDDTVLLKVYQLDKTGGTASAKKEFEISSKVRIDGVLYKNDPAAVSEILKKAATAANEGKVTGNAGTEYASFVRYETEGTKIAVIDTILDENGALSTESDERYNTLVRSTYVYNENEELDGKHKYCSTYPYGFYKTKTQDRFRVRANSSSTLLLFVPGNRGSESGYKAGKFLTTNFYNGMEYYVEAYNVDSQKYAQFVLQYMTDGKEDVTAYSTQAVVTGIDMDARTAKITYMMYSKTTSTTKSVAESSPADDMIDDLNIGDVILFSENSSGEIYDFYKALDITDPPVGRIDKEELLYSNEADDNKRIKGFDFYPDGVQRPTQKNVKYRTVYGTATDFDSSDYLFVNPYLGTDYIHDRADKLTESFSIKSSTLKVFVYDESQTDKNKIKTYSGTTAIRKLLKGEDDDVNFTTAKANGGEYDGADQVFIYMGTSGTSSDSYASLRFIYIIKSPSRQSNPANYPGVVTPEEDPLADKKTAAINELKAFNSDASYTGKNKTEYSAALAAGIEAIESAESEEAIASALADAKDAIDEIIADGTVELKIEEISFYVSPEDYPEAQADIEKIIADAKAKISAAAKNSEIDAAVTEAKAAIDALTGPLLSKYREDAKAEIDKYVSDNSEAIDETEEFTAYISEVKEKIDACTDPNKIKEAVEDAKAYIDGNIAAKALPGLKESAKAEIAQYASENAAEYSEDEGLAAIISDANAAIDGAADSDAVEAAKSDAKAKIDAFVAEKNAQKSESGDESEG